MAHVNKEVLRFLIGQVDWNVIMLDLLDRDPDQVASLVNHHFTAVHLDSIDQKYKENVINQSEALVDPVVKPAFLVDRAADGLGQAFTHCARAINTRGPDGHYTTGDKIKAIKKLRETFGLNLLEAKNTVELMMRNYEEDPLYYPSVLINTETNGFIFR